MNVDYFFDPVCPFCWMTSKWIRQVVPHRELEVDWRFISLRVINDGRYEDERMAAKLPGHTRGLQLLRVCAAAKDRHGPDATGRLYEAMGTDIWESGGRKPPQHTLGFDDERLAEALAAAGLSAALTDAQHDESWDEAIVTDSETALDRAGRDVGTPIITFGPPEGSSFFGPVISTLPTVEASLEIWDSLVTLSTHPDFAELKRAMRAKVDLPTLR